MVFMKVQEKMKIGIFQPNINHYPSIDDKLIKLEEILNQHDLDLLVLPELFLSFYLSKEQVSQYTNEDVQFFKQKILQISEKFQCHLVCGYPEFKNNEKYKNDHSLIDESSENAFGRMFTKSYLRHLFNVNEILGLRIASTLNLYYYYSMMKMIQKTSFFGLMFS